MIPIIETLNQIRKGKYKTINSMLRYSSTPRDLLKEKMDEIVNEGYMIKLNANIYVIRELSDEEQQELKKLINKKRAEIENKTDDRTEVSISGTLVEDKTYKTDKEPAEIIK